MQSQSPPSPLPALRCGWACPARAAWPRTRWTCSRCVPQSEPGAAVACAEHVMKADKPAMYERWQRSIALARGGVLAKTPKALMGANWGHDHRATGSGHCVHSAWPCVRLPRFYLLHRFSSNPSCTMRASLIGATQPPGPRAQAQPRAQSELDVRVTPNTLAPNFLQDSALSVYKPNPRQYVAKIPQVREMLIWLRGREGRSGITLRPRCLAACHPVAHSLI